MAGALRHPIRTFARLTRFLAVSGTGILDHIVRLRSAGKGDDPRECAAWLQTWSRRNMRAIRVASESSGPLPDRGLIVCNHLSYLDIPVIGAVVPTIFVSKAEVRRWPYLGSLARCAGTLFLNRESRGHVAEIARRFQSIVDGGTLITVFPEGTSSGGDRVLPFRPSLLEPAVANAWPVTPAWITYELEDGTVIDDVAYWRDMTFGPHFLNLLSKRWILGRVTFGSPVHGIRDRKELARRLHAEVCALRERGLSRNEGASCSVRRG